MSKLSNYGNIRNVLTKLFFDSEREVERVHIVIVSVLFALKGHSYLTAEHVSQIVGPRNGVCEMVRTIVEIYHSYCSDGSRERGRHNVVIFDTIVPYLIAVYDSLRTHRFAWTFSHLNSTLDIFESSFLVISASQWAQLVSNGRNLLVGLRFGLDALLFWNW